MGDNRKKLWEAFNLYCFENDIDAFGGGEKVAADMFLDFHTHKEEDSAPVNVSKLAEEIQKYIYEKYGSMGASIKFVVNHLHEQGYFKSPSKWNSMETALGDDIRVLCLTESGLMRVDYLKNGAWYKEHPSNRYTHWMPRPNPPNPTAS